MPDAERGDAELMPAGRRWAVDSAALMVAGVVVLCGLALTSGPSAARLAGGVVVFATVWVAVNGFLFHGVPSPQGLAEAAPASASPALSAIPRGYVVRVVGATVAISGVVTATSVAVSALVGGAQLWIAPGILVGMGLVEAAGAVRSGRWQRRTGIELVVAKPGWRGKPTYYTFTRPA